MLTSDVPQPYAVLFGNTRTDPPPSVLNQQELLSRLLINLFLAHPRKRLQTNQDSLKDTYERASAKGQRTEQ